MRMFIENTMQYLRTSRRTGSGRVRVDCLRNAGAIWRLKLKKPRRRRATLSLDYCGQSLCFIPNTDGARKSIIMHSLQSSHNTAQLMLSCSILHICLSVSVCLTTSHVCLLLFVCFRVCLFVSTCLSLFPIALNLSPLYLCIPPLYFSLDVSLSSSVSSGFSRTASPLSRAATPRASRPFSVDRPRHRRRAQAAQRTVSPGFHKTSTS